ncbi:hypothetical protein TWF281_000960 [Arthrobotrys megalospora]
MGDGHARIDWDSAGECEERLQHRCVNGTESASVSETCMLKAVLPGYRSDAVMQRGAKPPLRRGTVGQSGDGLGCRPDGVLSAFESRQEGADLKFPGSLCRGDGRRLYTGGCIFYILYYHMSSRRGVEEEVEVERRSRKGEKEEEEEKKVRLKLRLKICNPYKQ